MTKRANPPNFFGLLYAHNIALKHFRQFDSDHLNYSVAQRSEKGGDRKQARSKFLKAVQLLSYRI